MAVTAEGVNGLVEVGDLIAYPSRGGLRKARVKRVSVSSWESYQGTVTGTRIHVVPVTRTSWCPYIVLRNPANVAVLEKAGRD